MTKSRRVSDEDEKCEKCWYEVSGIAVSVQL